MGGSTHVHGGKLYCPHVEVRVSLLRGDKNMSGMQISTREPSMSAQVKKLRLSSLLTQKELAVAADVSCDEVNRMERGLPLPLNAKRKILKELWARKFGS